MYLVNPPVKKIDLHFPLGLEVSARNSKGVTIKDALDAIHKQFKKKVFLSSVSSDHTQIGLLTSCQSNDELDKPYLAGFEWNKNDCWTRLVVHQSPGGTTQQQPSKKTKKREEA